MSGARVVGANHVHRLVRMHKPLLASNSASLLLFGHVAEHEPC